MITRTRTPRLCAATIASPSSLQVMVKTQMSSDCLAPPMSISMRARLVGPCAKVQLGPRRHWLPCLRGGGGAGRGGAGRGGVRRRAPGLGAAAARAPHLQGIAGSGKKSTSATPPDGGPEGMGGGG